MEGLGVTARETARWKHCECSSEHNAPWSLMQWRTSFSDGLGGNPAWSATTARCLPPASDCGALQRCDDSAGDRSPRANKPRLPSMNAGFGTRRRDQEGRSSAPSIRVDAAPKRGASWGLTFDMSGGAKGAKRPLGRPLDGGVRPRLHERLSCELSSNGCALQCRTHVVRRAVRRARRCTGRCPNVDDADHQIVEVEAWSPAVMLGTRRCDCQRRRSPDEQPVMRQSTTCAWDCRYAAAQADRARSIPNDAQHRRTPDRAQLRRGRDSKCDRRS